VGQRNETNPSLPSAYQIQIRIGQSKSARNALFSSALRPCVQVRQVGLIKHASNRKLLFSNGLGRLTNWQSTWCKCAKWTTWTNWTLIRVRSSGRQSSWRRSYAPIDARVPTRVPRVPSAAGWHSWKLASHFAGLGGHDLASSSAMPVAACVCVKLASAMQSISAACLSIEQAACSGVRVCVKLTSAMQSISAASRFAAKISVFGKRP
jgi:hypothetical protein